jgi:hypothetical protein
MTPAQRAVSHLGLAGMQALAARTQGSVPPAPQHPQRRTVVRLWLPTTAIFLLLSPFALLLAPLIYLAPPPYGGRPLATVLGVGRLLLSLGGTVVDVETPGALVRIRIF